MVHSAKMGGALKILERMVNQNAEDEIFQDFKYWEVCEYVPDLSIVSWKICESNRHDIRRLFGNSGCPEGNLAKCSACYSTDLQCNGREVTS